MLIGQSQNFFLHLGAVIMSQLFTLPDSWLAISSLHCLVYTKGLRKSSTLFSHILHRGLHSSLLLVKGNIFKNIHSLKWGNQYKLNQESVHDVPELGGKGQDKHVNLTNWWELHCMWLEGSNLRINSSNG